MRAARLIAEARRLGGISQATLARRLGTKQPAIARWESGRQSPSFDTLERIARACGLNLAATLMPRDEGEEALLWEWLRLSPKERLERNEAMLATEAWAARARAARKERA